MQIYKTSFNGNKPYLVKINRNIVNVFALNRITGQYNVTSELSVKSEKIWIGENGNTVFVMITPNFYYFISNKIESYSTDTAIVSYSSDLRDIPLAYAVDEKSNRHLLNEKVILKPTEKLISYANPYDYYYVHNVIWSPNGIHLTQTDITDFRVGGKSYDLIYNANPQEVYQYITMFGTVELYTSEGRYFIQEKDYIDLINSFYDILFT